MPSTRPLVLVAVGLLGLFGCGSRSGLANPIEAEPAVDAAAPPDASIVDAHQPDSPPITDAPSEIPPLVDAPPDAPPPPCEWSRMFGERADLLGMDVDGAGNVILGGRFQNSIDFGSGPIAPKNELDGFIAELDTSGNVLWSHVVSGTGPDSVNGVAFDGTGNVVALVTSNQKSRVVRYDPSGKELGTSTDLDYHFYGIVTVAADGTIVVAYTAVASEDAVLAALDPSGTQVLWKKTFPDVSWFGNTAKPLAVANGRAIIVGVYGGTPDFGGGPLPLESGTGGSFAVAFDLLGNFVFSTALQVENTYPTSVSVAPDGKIWIASRDGPTLQMRLVRLTAAGQQEFTQVFSAKTGEWTDIDVRSGGLTLAAAVGGTYDFGGGPATTSDPFGAEISLTQFDSSPKYLHSRRFGGKANGFLHLAVRGDAYIGGGFSGSIDFGQGELTADSSVFAFYVAKCAL